MVKKLFALASVTALSGLTATMVVSGCSVTESPVTPTDAGPTTDGPKVVPPKPDTGGEEDTGVTGKCPTTTPITAADIDSQIKWLPPVIPPQNVCDQSNIDALKALFAKGGGSASFKDMKTAVGAKCAACGFSAVAGPNWGPVVEVGTGGAIDNRTGSCMAQLETPACGKARFQWEECLDQACLKENCTEDKAKIDACQAKAVKGACKDLTAAEQAACPNEADTLPICGNLVTSLTVSCSGGKDSGIDSGP